MARPRIVRADTLDLQDHTAPSAKDHSKQPVPANEGTGLAPHQEKEVRLANHDSKTEIMNGPDGSDGYHTGIDIYDDTDDIQIGLGVHRGESDNGDAEDGDHSDGDDDDLLDDELMDKISSSPSIDDDDINFEFVYALHNFVATVDGQANALKGDNMVLLDDSNSYWWLVRIVKDGSIGYLPAEHIETPTERLARLNKHRNVDLSATMLGDNLEKSKNPLKKAMRRRNAKNVTFTSPTYIEASDIEYSTEEEMDDDDVSFTDEYARDEYDQREEQNEDIVVEPLRPKSQRDKGAEETQNAQEPQEPTAASPEKQRPSQEMFDQEDATSPTSSEFTVSRSRNGTIRNTDSFFKDDAAETKKISLTPNLLRDEAASNEPREPRISLETLDKVSSNEKKDDKKRKDKKPGMLSGLFKRKDKKSKGADEDGEDMEKHSGELSRSSPTPKTSSESVVPEARSTKQVGPQRQTSKLQKQPPEAASATQDPAKESPVQKEGVLRENQRSDQTIRQVVLDEVDEIAGSSRSKPNEAERSMPNSISIPSHLKKPMSPTSPTSPISPISPGEAPSDRQISPSQGENAHSVTSPPQKFPPNQTMFLDSPVSASSPLERQRSPSTPGLATDLPTPGYQLASPDSPPLSPADTTDSRWAEAAPTPFEAPTPTWSDASLRSYLEDENELRDLYVIVYDNTNIPPAGPEHPITGNLFKVESKRLREMNSQLDSLLSDWVSKRAQKPASQ